MPSAQREAFLLREIRGLSYSQLAAELSLSAPSPDGEAGQPSCWLQAS
jgi:Sigma-70, region 4